ncbi:TonB-dependent receptor domain-containing protein [Methylosinus sp. Sm6]|uniref:TonB-dependent receptor domain-containing protein n=1 Tax=Methylosinus sp. Sm6 TaxID=2866948 RepID=UPI001C9927B1|nr:TonB-dependent receptor [Methylosinus sp. Sm6]
MFCLTAAHQTATQLGFYGQDQINLDDFVLTVGTRYDEMKITPGFQRRSCSISASSSAMRRSRFASISSTSSASILRGMC